MKGSNWLYSTWKLYLNTKRYKPETMRQQCRQAMSSDFWQIVALQCWPKDYPWDALEGQEKGHMRSRVITLHGTVWYSIFGIIERKYFYYIMIRSCPGHINSNIDQLLLVICSKSNSKIRKNCRNGIFRKIEKKNARKKFCWEKILMWKFRFAFSIFQREIIVFICCFCDMLCIYGAGCLGNLETIYGILLWLFFKLAWSRLLSGYICNCFYAKERSQKYRHIDFSDRIGYFVINITIASWRKLWISKEYIIIPK